MRTRFVLINIICLLSYFLLSQGGIPANKALLNFFFIIRLFFTITLTPVHAQ